MSHSPSHPQPDRSFLEALPQPAIVLGRDGRVLELNDLAADMFGSRSYVLEGDPVRVLGDDRAFSGWLGASNGEPVIGVRLEGLREDDVPIILDLSARRSGHGGDAAALCLLKELSEDRLAGEAQLHFDTAFEHAPIGMALFNTHGSYIRVNEALCEMLGYSEKELIGRRDQEFTHPDDRQSDVDAAWRILRGELDTWQCEKRFLRSDGTVIWTIANLTFLRSADGLPLSWVGQFQDITERKVHEERLRELAHRDPLTGVLNRRGLESALEDLIAGSREGAMLVVDLDRFKEINDAHGHRAGDLVLVTVASALRDAIRGDDVVARLGGDEFAVIAPGACEAEAQSIATLLGEVVSAQRFVFDAQTSITASVGVTAFSPEQQPSAAALLAEADKSMYRAKANGKGDQARGRRRTDD